MGIFSKYERARRAQQEGNKAQGIRPAREDARQETEKGDFFALWLSAMLTIFPAALGALLLIGGIAWLLIPK